MTPTVRTSSARIAPRRPRQGASVQSGTLLQEKGRRVREEPRLRGLPTFGLAMAGLVLGHVLAYLIAVPDPHHRAFVLQRTGHEYLPAMAEAALVLALAGMAAVVIRAFAPGPRGGSERFSRLAGRLGLVQVLAFGGLEVVERIVAGAPAPPSGERPHPGDRHGGAGRGRPRRRGVPPMARANLEQARRDGSRSASRSLGPEPSWRWRAHRGVPASARSARSATSEPRPPPEPPLRRCPRVAVRSRPDTSGGSSMWKRSMRSMFAAALCVDAPAPRRGARARARGAQAR